jgi:hypothetical protein
MHLASYLGPRDADRASDVVPPPPQDAVVDDLKDGHNQWMLAKRVPPANTI